MEAVKDNVLVEMLATGTLGLPARLNTASVIYMEVPEEGGTRKEEGAEEEGAGSWLT